MSWSAFSQNTPSQAENLIPRIHAIDGDTFLCFTLQQGRSIARELIANQYCDSLEREYQDVQVKHDSLLASKEDRISLLNQQIANWKARDLNHGESIGLLEDALADRERKIKRGRFHKWLLGGALTISTGLLLLNR